ncbi:hypothetical protein B0T13DRAFT_520318 [Neurospora crassa]|nr:hypothetical protein B0T13DRAFT_520318 [Neurospora crassa]
MSSQCVEVEVECQWAVKATLLKDLDGCCWSAWSRRREAREKGRRAIAKVFTAVLECYGISKTSESCVVGSSAYIPRSQRTRSQCQTGCKYWLDHVSANTCHTTLVCFAVGGGVSAAFLLPIYKYEFLPKRFPLQILVSIRRPEPQSGVLVALRVKWIGGSGPDSTSGTVTGPQG